MRAPSAHCSGKSYVLWVLGLALLSAAVIVAQRRLLPPLPPPALSMATTQLIPPRALQDVALVDHQGRNFTRDHLLGNWSFLFFGYTHCPDICPTTLSTLNAVSRKIAALPNPPPIPQYVFISIDPERDTPERLASFVPYFNPDFLGVTGTAQAVAAFTKQLSVAYLKVDSTRPEGYLMDHSASLYLIDPLGRLHALMSPPFDTTQLAQDYQKLTQYYEAYP